ncbi:MAG: c-type cytochrome [Pseudomonadota bacterium]
MLDTMTFTKILGGFCGALLIFLLGKWVAEEMYAMGGGHGDDHGPAYVIDTGDGGEETAEAEEGPSFAELYASADIAAGEKVFGKCKACHAVEDGENKVGPHLFEIVGRDVAAVGDFNYSGALSEVASVWTPEELDGFLENPKGYAPGTSMGFAGLKKIQDRVDVIAYLDSTDGSMTELVVPAAAEEEPAAEEATEETAAEEPAAEEATEETASEEATEEVTEEAATEEVTEDAPEAAEDAAEEEAAAEEPAAEEATEEAASDESGFAALVAAADIAAGERAYKKCAACHVPDEEQNRVGPHLVNLVDREIASVDGFNYSGALTELGGVWDLDRLSAWLENPREFAPGNKMSFRGVSDEEERANIIGYLQSLAQ